MLAVLALLAVLAVLAVLSVLEVLAVLGVLAVLELVSLDASARAHPQVSAGTQGKPRQKYKQTNTNTTKNTNTPPRDTNEEIDYDDSGEKVRYPQACLIHQDFKNSAYTEFFI